MGFDLIKSVRDTKMHSTVKLLALCMVIYADKNGRCYPSIVGLMDDTGLSNRTVCKCIKDLEELGYLRADRSNGRRSTYQFNIQNIAKAVTDIHQLPCVTSDSDDAKPVTLVHDPVTLVHEPVTESHTNSQEKPLEQPKEQPRSSAREMPKVGFVKPDLPQVVEYFSNQGSRIQAEPFFDHFQSNGWKVGGKSKMEDWHAAARNWIRRSKEFQNNSSAPKISQADKWNCDDILKPQMKSVNEPTNQPMEVLGYAN